jgi:alkanesulfonate monooxygenase SsuD/methylene tetrahydromethanopterin reductase-like flavin-dependent oxidoreductase (luciferase family)
MKVGILFPTAFADSGEYLADARAYDAAGADCLWIAAGPEADALTLLAALAAVTGRTGLGIIAGSPVAVRALEGDERLKTLQRLARGRLRIGVASSGGVEDQGERWLRVEAPADRAAWRAALESVTKAGAAGVLVAADPRLVDLLRHPADETDRSDLMLSTG